MYTPKDFMYLMEKEMVEEVAKRMACPSDKFKDLSELDDFIYIFADKQNDNFRHAVWEMMYEPLAQQYFPEQAPK